MRGSRVPAADESSLTSAASSHTRVHLRHFGAQKRASRSPASRATHSRRRPGDQIALINPTSVLTLRGRPAWAHDWVSDPSLAAVFQARPGAGFIVDGAAPAKNAALASAGAELRLANGVTLLGRFDGEFAGNAQTYTGTGTVRWAW
jgi:hypothetical protein